MGDNKRAEELANRLQQINEAAAERMRRSVAVVWAPPPHTREAGPYDKLQATSVPTEMQLIQSHFRQEIVPISFLVPDFDEAVTLYIQIDGLLTPNRLSHIFRARIYRLYWSQNQLVYEREKFLLEGIIKSDGGASQVNLPPEFVPSLAGYVRDCQTVADRIKWPLYLGVMPTITYRA